jgi:hypothetical protein
MKRPKRKHTDEQKVPETADQHKGRSIVIHGTNLPADQGTLRQSKRPKDICAREGTAGDVAQEEGHEIDDCDKQGIIRGPCQAFDPVRRISTSKIIEDGEFSSLSFDIP